MERKIRLYQKYIFCSNIESRMLRMIETIFMLDIFYQMAAENTTITYVLYHGLQNDSM